MDTNIQVLLETIDLFTIFFITFSLADQTAVFIYC